MENRDVFKRQPKQIRLMGKDFTFEFIPSEHFQEVLMSALEIATKLDIKVDGWDVNFKLDTEKIGAQLYQIARSVLNERIYLLMSDVLKYQNDTDSTVQELKKTVSVLELAQFIELVMDDEELFAAIEVFKSSLGKLGERMKSAASQLQTESSTQSSPTTLDITTDTSISE